MIATRRRSPMCKLSLAAAKSRAFRHLEPCGQPGARPRPGTDLQGAAQRRDALAHSEQAQTVAGDLIAGLEPRPRIGDLDLDHVACVLAAHRLAAAAGMAVGIVERLLREAVEAGLDRR